MIDTNTLGALASVGCFVLAFVTYLQTRSKRRADKNVSVGSERATVALIVVGFVIAGLVFWRTSVLVTENNAPDRIRDWLKDSATSIRELPEQERGTSTFAFDVILPSGKGVTVEQIKNKHAITVSTAEREEADWQKLISDLPHDKFKTVATMCQIELARSGFQYHFDLAQGYYLISKDISIENLTYDNLMGAIGGEAETITIVQGTLFLQLFPAK